MIPRLDSKRDRKRWELAIERHHQIREKRRAGRRDWRRRKALAEAEARRFNVKPFGYHAACALLEAV